VVTPNRSAGVALIHSVSALPSLSRSPTLRLAAPAGMTAVFAAHPEALGGVVGEVVGGVLGESDGVLGVVGCADAGCVAGVVGPAPFCPSSEHPLTIIVRPSAAAAMSATRFMPSP
jgi:hypothetical protein